MISGGASIAKLTDEAEGDMPAGSFSLRNILKSSPFLSFTGEGSDVLGVLSFLFVEIALATTSLRRFASSISSAIFRLSSAAARMLK